LVGVAEPVLAGAAPLRPVVKTLFIRIDDSHSIDVLLPYVTLEDEARGCIRALAAEELSVPERRVEVRDDGHGHALVDVGRPVERSLQACAAVARTLLVAAAAENWNLPAALCRAAQGSVCGPGRTTAYGDIAADAALCQVPGWIQLRCGRYVLLSPPARGVAESLACAD
jgi:isoquinoline 1-oxidoreductase beta subunit